MACYYPLDGWLASNPNDSGKRSVVFSLSEGLSDHPVSVPCGKCIGCRADQSLMWSIRAYHESTLHVKNSFLTLTYSDDNLPDDNKIKKNDLQLFFKRLRKKYKIRYIACGEYGEKTARPHYHAIIFGQDFLHDKIPISRSGDFYTSEELVKTWGLGYVTCASVNYSSIAYVCGYCHKKIGDTDTFSLMSRRPGIGHDWLLRYHDDLQRTGTVTIDGREFPVPPRYLQWLPDEFEELKRARKAIVQEREAFDYRVSLRSRETNRAALIKQKQEKL